MDQLRRRLPHVWAEGKRLFVTWHLYGSLPHALYPPPNNKMRDKPLSGWTGISTQPVLDRST